jgi:hypothetical protein
MAWMPFLYQPIACLFRLTTLAKRTDSILKDALPMFQAAAFIGAAAELSPSGIALHLPFTRQGRPLSRSFKECIYCWVSAAIAPPFLLGLFPCFSLLFVLYLGYDDH